MRERESLHRFEGRLSERTWLIGILRNKVLQYLKNKYREVPECDLNPEGVEEGSFFDHVSGMWHRPPSDWSLAADDQISQKEFWGIFNSCLEGLPPQAAQAFILREMQDQGTRDISGTATPGECGNAARA